MAQIPQNLIVFFHDKTVMPDAFRTSLDATMAANPDFNLIFMDDETTPTLIEGFFPHFEEIYGRITVPAARSDLARLLALYHYGGVYVDIAMGFRTPFSSLFGPDDALFLVRRDDNQNYRNRPEAAHLINGIIGAAAKQGFILDCLKRIFYNISERFINFNVNVATGPGVITETFLARCETFSFPYKIENFSTLKGDHFTYHRVAGVSNSWVETQRKGIISGMPSATMSPQDRAWRAFEEQAGVRLFKE